MIILRQKSFGLFGGLFKKKPKIQKSDEEWIKESLEWEDVNPEEIDPDFWKFIQILDIEKKKLPNSKRMEEDFELPYVSCTPDFGMKGKNWIQILCFGEDTKEDHLYYCPETKEWLFWDTTPSKDFTTRKKFKDIILPMLGDWYYSQKNLLQMYKDDEDEVPEYLPESIKFLGKMIGICKREFKISR